MSTTKSTADLLLTRAARHMTAIHDVFVNAVRLVQV